MAKKVPFWRLKTGAC